VVFNAKGKRLLCGKLYSSSDDGCEVTVEQLAAREAKLSFRCEDGQPQSITVPIVGYSMEVDIEFVEGRPTWPMSEIVQRIIHTFNVPMRSLHVLADDADLRLVTPYRVQASQGATLIGPPSGYPDRKYTAKNASWAIEYHNEISKIFVWPRLARSNDQQVELWRLLEKIAG